MCRYVVPLLLLVAVISPSASAQTAAPAAPDAPVVVSTGEAVVKRTPDRAWVQVTAESRARSPREAQKLNADAMSAVLQRLKGLGLTGEAVQTRGYELHPEYDYTPPGKQTLRGYLARNTIEVRIDDLPRIGEILDAAVTAGATSVGSIRFDLKERAAAERDAVRLAVQDARSRAEAAAAGAGMKVERVVKIEEHRLGFVPPPRPMVAMRAEMAQGAGEPPVQPGELEIRASVTLTAAIK